MSEQELPEAVREAAGLLAWHPDDEFALQRMAVRIRERIDSRATVFGVLSRWLAPVAATLLALTIVSTGMALYDQNGSASPGDLATVVDAGLLHEDFYSAAR